MRIAAIPALLLLAGCLSPTAPLCSTVESRYVAYVSPWRVVCLGKQTVVGSNASVQFCAVFPEPPQAPEWVGQPDSMATHGYPLREVIVCTDTKITDTPI